MEYLCWDPDGCDENDARVVSADSASEAATLCAERWWADDDHPMTQTIRVKPRGSNAVTVEEYTIETEMEPAFVVVGARVIVPPVPR